MYVKKGAFAQCVEASIAAKGTKKYSDKRKLESIGFSRREKRPFLYSFFVNRVKDAREVNGRPILFAGEN